ncbi:MAG: BTAD domain-containing putative transcriptional regulator, partial [Bacteroidota bacterium]
AKKPVYSLKATLKYLAKYFSLSTEHARRPSMAMTNSSLHFNSMPINISPEKRQDWEYKEENSASVEVKLMGKFEIFIQGKKMTSLPGKKGQGLLSYLFYFHPRPIAREILMETFWPKVATSSSRNSLNVALHGIRKSFEKFSPDSDILIYKNGAYSLNPEWEITVDVKSFINHWKRGQSMETSTGIVSAISCYEKAASFYTNTLLMDDLYSEWIQPERDNLQETYLAILERLIDYRIDMEEYKLAHHYGEQALRIDACREHIHRQIMLAHCKSGRRNQAIRQYQRCCEVLREELNIGPAPRTQEMFEKIRSNQLG